MAMVESAADSDRPALVLDMDGVLVAWNKDKPPPEYITCQDPWRPDAYYDPAHGDWLRHIHEARADIYYISDAQDKTHEFVSRTHDLPEFDWINVDPYLPEVVSYHALRAMAITSLFGSPPVAWIDDIITDLEFRWAEVRSAEGAPTLVVKTELQTGLQQEHMTSVEGWLGGVARH
jgi:hypothetical protein